MIKFFTILGISMTLCCAVKAQVIKGTVYDKNTKETIIGASITVKEHPGKGVMADEQGKFTLQLQTGETLIVKMIGYKHFQKQYTAVKAGQQIDISLEPGLEL